MKKKRKILLILRCIALSIQYNVIENSISFYNSQNIILRGFNLMEISLTDLSYFPKRIHQIGKVLR